MIDARIVQSERLIAETQLVRVYKSNGRDRSARVFALGKSFGSFLLGDNSYILGEQIRGTDVIGVLVAIDEIFNRLGSDFRNRLKVVRAQRRRCVDGNNPADVTRNIVLYAPSLTQYKPSPIGWTT
jgi:hypothetical protein